MAEPYVVAFLGGSITWGSGATDPERTSFRSLVTEHLRERLSPRSVVAVNAAVGGTGSDFGLFRLRRDVLNANPHLVFVEFAVNDNGLDQTWRRRSFESLIRKLLSGNAAPHIVVLLTTRRTMSDEDEARHQESCRDHRRIAEHYGLPVIDVGASLRTHCDGGCPMDTVLPDGVHPSDAGYRVYADAIIEGIANLPLESPSTVHEVAPLHSGIVENVTMVAAAENPGALDLPVVDLKTPYLSGAWQLLPGDGTLRLTVDGGTFGLVWWVSSDSGSIRWRIDEGDWTETRCWDEYARHFDRINYTVLAKDLPDRSHQQEILASDVAVPGSEGFAIRIAAYFTGR